MYAFRSDAPKLIVLPIDSSCYKKEKEKKEERKVHFDTFCVYSQYSPLMKTYQYFINPN